MSSKVYTPCIRTNPVTHGVLMLLPEHNTSTARASHCQTEYNQRWSQYESTRDSKGAQYANECEHRQPDRQ